MCRGMLSKQHHAWDLIVLTRARSHEEALPNAFFGTGIRAAATDSFPSPAPLFFLRTKDIHRERCRGCCNQRHAGSARDSAHPAWTGDLMCRWLFFTLVHLGTNYLLRKFKTTCLCISKRILVRLSVCYASWSHMT